MWSVNRFLTALLTAAGLFGLAVFTGCRGVADAPPGGGEIPEHPFMAPNGRSNVHNDAYMTDSYAIPGPGSSALRLSFWEMNRICITIVPDGEGFIRTLCTGSDSGRAAYILDPVTMTALDSYELPAAADLSVSGAGYFYLDRDDRMIVPTADKHIYVFAPPGITPRLELEHRYDLGMLPDPLHIVSVLPDWGGRIWFVTEEGLVGILDASGAPKTLALTHTENSIETGESIYTSFAVDETGGVYIVTDEALYRCDADVNATPTVTWREPYDRGTQRKPGQFSRGSGTTPTVVGREFVAITDNAEPRMNVLVYRRGREAEGERLLCKIPVFELNASATENSLIAYGNSVIVENNYGYTGITDFVGKLSAPGMSRIDIGADGNCSVVWNADVIVPSVISKYSAADRTVYTYTKDAQGWYFTEVDFESGAVRFRTKVGPDEPRYNNHYSGILLATDGSVYVGTAGGIIRFRPD